MASSATSRAKFINSLLVFMNQFGFQGADLDWEYPAIAERGGRREDTQNFVLLVQEMRAAFGTNYGISLPLAPDYWSLRGFDPRAMEPYVDFFGFMAYDLHGSWDADVKTLGSVVRGQADLREIYNDTLPLWFDGLNPSKINFGLAYYGRGYTLESSSCNHPGCKFIGPSKPAPCTNSKGVMSLVEIEQLIAEKSLVQELLSDIMMKQITWDDQWIGYDDAETIALKTAFADNLCFGGTMIWSIDSYSGIGDGNTPILGEPTVQGRAVANNNTVCTGWSAGDCCSSGGWCGSSAAHCGNGCQSASCVIDGPTIDGSCGTLNGNSTCKGWPTGGCCSSSGWCGDTAALCGDGCLGGPCYNGDGVYTPSGDVYISPEIWETCNPEVGCYPPCTIILPPLLLQTPTTIKFPPWTTSLDVAWLTTSAVTVSPGLTTTTTTYYKHIVQITVLTIPTLTTTEIEYWNINITDIRQTTTTLHRTRSIVPPPFTITDDPNPEKETGVIHPPVTRTITPVPHPQTRNRKTLGHPLPTTNATLARTVLLVLVVSVNFSVIHLTPHVGLVAEEEVEEAVEAMEEVAMGYLDSMTPLILMVAPQPSQPRRAVLRLLLPPLRPQPHQHLMSSQHTREPH